MGVISVGASLGVREARAAAPVASAAASAAPARRSPGASGGANAACAAAGSRKKSARKRVAGAAAAGKKRAANHGGARATAGACAARRSPSPSARDVTPSVTLVINGKKPVGRMVHVRTSMDPQLLAPHVIGVNGGKLNDIMSRARCSISYRKTEAGADGFSMAFMISATTAKRVDDGVQLLQAVVESTEHRLKKCQHTGEVPEIGNGDEKQGDDAVQDVAMEVVDMTEETQRQEADRHSVEERRAQARIQQEDVPVQVGEHATETGQARSRSAPQEERTTQQNRHPKRRRDESGTATGSAKRERSNQSRDTRPQRSERHPLRNEDVENKDYRETIAAEAAARAEEERRLRDEREAFRIRLERTVMISRQLEAETTRARAKEVLERDKYLRLRRKFEEMKHRKNVAEFVVKQQCSAMTASLSTSSPSNKRQRLLEIEQLGVAHNGCPADSTRILAPNLRTRAFKMKRAAIDKSRLPGLQRLKSGLAENDDLARLAKRVQAFGTMITSGSIELPATESVNDMATEEVAENVEDTADPLEFPSEDVDTSMDVPCANDVNDHAAVDMVVEDNDGMVEEKNTPRRESFRSTWEIPGLSRDLNLIQDYSAETDCKLLRFLAGERQYFYLEPLVTSDLSYSHDVGRWLLTAHDLQILHRYLLEHADFGKQLVLCAERLRALGNLVPPLPSSSDSEAALSAELGVFESSRHKEWSEMQDKIVTLHSLAMVAHMVGKHYLGRQAIGSNRDTGHAGSSHDNLLDEGTLESDLFTYILRPIRSSAIESSLFDSLPISLVRETIEQCPEVVNHVLQWKGKDDVPEYLREVDPCDTSVSVSISSSENADHRTHPRSNYFLRNLLMRLTACMRDLDAVMKELAATLKEKRPSHHKDNVSQITLRRQHIIQHVNRIKSVTTSVIVENTKLQLHKWWILFAENSCAWFDPDDVDEMDDRSYDKFTCLQDALYIWHNEALLYTTKDDFVAPERLTEAPLDNSDEIVDDNGYITRTRSSSRSPGSRDASRGLMAREEEVAALLRLTPASMRDELQNRPFTQDEAKKSILTPLKVEKARTQLEESLAVTRDLMNELGHAGPWRKHVKHSNTLKRELAKQVAIQKKLVKHQWARYYTKYQDFAPSPARAANSNQDAEEKDETEVPETQPQGEPTLENGGTATSRAIDWTGVFDPETDAPEIIEMKKLRHEITLAKDQLLRDISGGNKVRPGAVLRSTSLNPDQKALVEECQGLAASCMQALGKFLGMEESSELPTTPVKKTPTKPSRAAAKSTRAEKRTTAASKGDKAAKASSSSDRRHSHGSKKARSSPASRSRRSESIRVAKALAASDVSLLLPIVRSSARSSSSRAMSVRSIGSSHARIDGSSPLRMGCSGCRDLRRRCTGCSGCCLHCVCVSCGCRMCCSSRLAAVQKTMTHLLDLIESSEACKWMSNASAGNEGHHCGMQFFCQQCHCCKDHCPCLLARSTSEPAVNSTTTPHAPPSSVPGSTDPSSSGFTASLNGTLRGAGAQSRRERRFKINPVAAQRRGPNMPTAGASSASAAHEGGNTGQGVPRGSIPMLQARTSHGGRGPLPTFDYGIEGAFGLGPMDQRGQCRTWRPAPSDKNEQEDLFRAARVRMKLVRSTFAKSMGLSPGSGCLDGEQLWQPERIRMMWERRDFHGVLGLPRDATTQQIKRQYRKLALKLHPDKASDTSASLESTVAEAGRNVGAGNSGKRVDAFVAATHSYKILLGDVDAMNGLK